MKAQAPASTPQLDLRFDFEAITRLAEIPSGINLLDGIEAEAMKDPKNYVRLVWAGLLHTNEALTETDARSQIRRFAPREVIRQVTEALARDIGATEEEKAAAAAKVVDSGAGPINGG